MNFMRFNRIFSELFTQICFEWTFFLKSKSCLWQENYLLCISLFGSIYSSSTDDAVKTLALRIVQNKENAEIWFAFLSPKDEFHYVFLVDAIDTFGQ